jgi:hypothetical protein
MMVTGSSSSGDSLEVRVHATDGHGLVYGIEKIAVLGSAPRGLWGRL